MAPDAPDEFPLTLEEFLARPTWHAKAACRARGRGSSWRGAKADYGVLRALCGARPVRDDCLAAALVDESLVGLWGGTDEGREIRRRGSAA